MRHTLARSLVVLVLLAVSAGPAGATERLLDNGWDGWTYVEAVKSTNPAGDREVADDFDVSGSIERVLVHGANGCIATCAGVPPVAGAYVRFHEWTAAGPGALQREEFFAGNDPGFLYDPAGPDTLDLTLHQPFPATGRHFVSFQIVYGDYFQWAVWVSHHGAAQGSRLLERDNRAGTGWRSHVDGLGTPLNDDLSFELYGCPPSGCPEPPVVAGCGTWNEVPSPNPAGVQRSILNGVDALAPWDAWAVGTFLGPLAGSATDQDQAMSMHWDGSTWSLVPTPSPGPNASTTSVELHDVSGARTDDVWAVGRKNGQDPGGYLGSRVLAMRWDGLRWTDMNAPWPADRDGSVYTGASGEQLYGVDALAPNDVWMVGRYWREQPSGSIAWPGVAMRWNGSAFETYELPMVSSVGRQWANAVSARATNDAWAVGEGDGASSSSYIWHWNGTSWASVPGPAPGADHALNAVLALSADDVWAGGWWRDASWVTYPLILHWDGSGWTQVPTPAGGDAFAAFAPDHIVTFGSGGWASWDGARWTPTAGPSVIPHGSVADLDVIADCDLWAVGRKSVAGDDRTLTERLSPLGAPGDRDRDGVPDASDNCPDQANPLQADCDGDGAGDACELTAGTARDCNGNGTPDGCEAFADCDADGVPDECQADCNGNGTPDTCDVASGTSRDCEPNGVPDECEIFDDCNGNRVNDACDVRSGSSADGNANAHPDECEALGPDDATVTTIDDVVDLGGAGTLADLPGPDGLVSFREALTAANNTPGPQRVAFNIPKERWDSLGSTRPLLRLDQGVFFVTDDATEIDFTTQARFTGDTNPAGNEVGIYGYEPNAWGAQAIQVSADDCVIRGLDSVQQRGYGVLIEGSRNRVVGSTISGPWHAAVYVRGPYGGPAAVDNVVGGTEPGEGNRLSSGNDGVRVDGPAVGTVVVGNQLHGTWHGVAVRAGASGTRIGGPRPEERNVISGSGKYGEEGCPVGAQVRVESSTGTVIEGNYVGTDIQGTAGAGQIGTHGILAENASGTTIRGNVVSDIYVEGWNHCEGDRWGTAIELASSPGSVVAGNKVGTDAAGTTPIRNLVGLLVGTAFGDPGGPAAVRIGGRGNGEGNVVTAALSTGVLVGASVSGVTVSGNSIDDNGGLGLSLSGTGNGGQVAPILTSAAGEDAALTVEGTLDSTPSASFEIELFAGPACDPSGRGEGRRFLGATAVATDGSGHASFRVTLPVYVPPGEVVTATATGAASGSTSEFSGCETVSQVACTSAPGAVAGVTLGPDPDSIAWSAFGPGVTYDVAREDCAQVSGGSWTCVAAGVEGAQVADPAVPAPGRSFCYAVRAVNACGAGRWGSESADRRPDAICP
jgi:hypothetical protein